MGKYRCDICEFSCNKDYYFKNHYCKCHNITINNATKFTKAPKRKLIYTIMNSNKLDILDVFLESMSLYGNIDSANTDILIYIKNDDINQINLKNKYRSLNVLFDIYHEDCKLIIFNYPTIDKYEKLIYINVFSVVTDCLHKFFHMMSNDYIRCVYDQKSISDSNIVLMKYDGVNCIKKGYVSDKYRNIIKENITYDNKYNFSNRRSIFVSTSHNVDDIKNYFKIIKSKIRVLFAFIILNCFSGD